MKHLRLAAWTVWFTLCWIGVAAAEPVSMIIGFVAATLKAGGIGAMLIKAAFGIALQIGSSLLQRAMAKRQPQPGISGQLQVGGNNSLSFVVGTYATAGSLEYTGEFGGNSGDTPNANHVQVVTVSDLPQGIIGSRIWINGQKCEIDFSVTHGLRGHPVKEFRKKGKDYLWIKPYDGSQTAADPYLLDKFGARPEKPWLSDMIGHGLTGFILTARVNRKLLTSLPAARVEPAALPLYDPRKDSTVGGSGSHRWGVPSTYEPTSNPAVIIYNILRGIWYGGELIYGPAIPATRLPLASWFAAMNECDMPVGGEPQFRGGYEIKTAEHEPIGVIQELLKGCNGKMIESGGVYKIHVGAPALPAAYIGDEDFVVTDEQEFEPFPGLENTFNGASANYPEPEAGWEMKDAPQRLFPAFEAEDDGRRLLAEFQFNAVPFPVQVQRLMKSMVEDGRRFRKHRGTLGPWAFALEPMDTISWTSAREGYSAKLFQLESMDDQVNGNQAVAFRETDPADFDWNAGTDELPWTVGPLVPQWPAAQSAEGFDAQPAIYTDDESREKRPSIRVSYSGDQDDVEAVDVRVYLRSTGELWYTARLPYGPTETDVGAPIVTKSEILSAYFVPNTEYEVEGEFVPFSGRDTVPSSRIVVLVPNVLIDARYDVLEGSVVASTIAANSISAAKLMDGAVTSIKIAGEAVTTAKLQVGAVTEEIIANGAVIAEKIGSGAVTQAKIAYEAVVASKIASDAVTSVKIANDAVTSLKLADLAVAAGKIADRSVTAIKQGVGNLDTVDPDPNFQDLRWWGLDVAGVTVETTPNSALSAGGWPARNVARLEGTVGSRFAQYFPVETGGRYRVRFWIYKEPGTTGTVGLCIHRPSVQWTEPLADLPGSRFARDIATLPDGWSTRTLDINNVNNSQWQYRHEWDLSAGFVRVAWEIVRASSSDLIVDGAVLASKIAADAVTAGKIEAGAITTDKLAAGAVTAEKIVSGAVVADKIATNAVTAGKVLAGAITAEKIEAGAVVAEKIAAGAVISEKIVADAITASKIVATDFTNLIPDSELQDASAWTLTNGAEIIATGWSGFRSKGNIVVPSAIAAWQVFARSRMIPVQVGDELALYGQAVHHTAVETSHYFNLAAYDASGTPVAGANKIWVNASWAGVEVRSYESSYVVPSGVRFVTFNVGTAGAANPANDQTFAYGGFMIRRKNAANLIVDGAITAVKIAADAVTADKIAASSVTTAKLGAGAVTADKIAASAVTADKILAGSITGDRIAANTITGDRIATRSITARSLVLTDFDNLIPNASLDYGMGGWVEEKASSGTIARYSGEHGVGAELSRAAGAQATILRPATDALSLPSFSVTPGESLRLSCKVRRTAGDSGGTCGITATAYYANGTSATVAVPSSTTNTPLDTTVECAGVYVVPANVVGMSLRFAYGTHVNSGTILVTEASARRMASGQLIVDGAITADKIAANAVTAGKIAAGSITADKMSVSAVSAITADLGIITAGTIKSADDKFVITVSEGKIEWFD